MMEQVIEYEFRRAFDNTRLPIRVYEDHGEIIVIVGNRVYVNVEPLTFCFVSEQDIVQFSR